MKTVFWHISSDVTNVFLYHPKPPAEEVFNAYQKRSETLYKKLAELKGKDVSTFEVKQIVGELDFVSRQLYQMDDVSAMMLELAEMYETDKGMAQYYDTAYGDGTAEYLSRAIRAFYC